MANFISPQGEYPRHIGDIQIEHPDYEYGQAIPDGWIEVALTPVPQHDSETHTLIELPPVEIDGVVTQQWATRPYTEEELAAIAEARTLIN